MSKQPDLTEFYAGELRFMVATSLNEIDKLRADILHLAKDKASDQLAFVAVRDERDSLRAELEKALYALEYAADMTKPNDMSGCTCPICTSIDGIEAIFKATA